MQITHLTANIAPNGRFYAYVSVVFDGVFKVKGIRIIVKQSGERLVLMPSRANRAGDMVEVAHPIDRDFRTYLDGYVLGEIDKLAARKAEVDAVASEQITL